MSRLNDVLKNEKKKTVYGVPFTFQDLNDLCERTISGKEWQNINFIVRKYDFRLCYWKLND